MALCDTIGMVWSYSRIKTFEDCPYKWNLIYVQNVEQEELFFSQYGSFMHDVIEKNINGILSDEEVCVYYIENFDNYIYAQAPSILIKESYFTKGLFYFSDFKYHHKNILEIETTLTFDVRGIPFQGRIDILAEDGGILVLSDNKSRDLKARKPEGKERASDRLLSEMFKQLYLYSIPIKEKYGKYPDLLEFNCFNNGSIIQQEFDILEYEKTQEWACDCIRRIEKTDIWTPEVNWFKCRNICGVNKSCDYYNMNFS